STSGILRAAESVVARNSGRLGKTMRAERGGGEKPRLAFLPDQDEEAAFCAALVQNARAKNPGSSAYGDWAILYRTNAQSLGFEMEFSRRAIPYRVVGSLKFYEREEIKDALAFLAFVANQRDEVAFRRIVNKPARALGQATVDALVEEARAFGGALLDAARAASEKMRPRARKGILAFIKVIDDAKALLKSGALNMEESAPAQKKKNPARADGELAPGEGLSLCAYRLVVDSGLAEHHLERDEISGNQRIANLQELFNEATLFPRTEEGLFAFLERMELDRAMDGDAEDDASADRVTLITFHNTKGLEFRKVIMTGLENGIFPREDKRGDELEEERRLFYVGATRAMDELYMTCCARRRTFGKSALAQPSIFLREIDAEFMKVLGNAPYGFGASASAGSGWGSSPTQTQSQAEIESGWSRGQRLFHDDYGYGFVAGVSDSDEGPVVLARFETGREIRFLSEHQGGAFEKIGGDD
ncbi:MAG: ATP-dependent helicase, partial [Treponema sp.]|nr:ATP-dependent helicase [Treponema sp.]